LETLVRWKEGSKEQDCKYTLLVTILLISKFPDADNQCLKDLLTGNTDPRSDKRRIETLAGGLLRKPYKLILDCIHFREWCDNESSRLLWIEGDPGRGKTMLLCGIIDDISEQPVLTEGSTSDATPSDTTIVSYFFCQGTDKRKTKATAVLRGLIYLLALQRRSLISHVRNEYDILGRELFENEDAFCALSEIFTNMLRDPKLTRAYLVIDALDECIEVSKLLKVIVTNAYAPGVKFIVSSRSSNEIESQLSDDAFLHLSLEKKGDISQAVGVYINEKVSRLAFLQKNEELKKEFMVRMREKANGSFLWVSFAIKDLQKLDKDASSLQDVRDISDPLKVLERLPGDLPKYYDQMMEKIRGLKSGQDICWSILSAVSVTDRPLYLLELGALSDIPTDLSEDTNSIKLVVCMCGSFLLLDDDGYVNLVHETAKKYLVTKAAATIFPSGFADIHYSIFSRSLEIMSRLQNLGPNIYNLRHLGDKVKTADPDPLSALRYSCAYWVDHLSKVDRNSRQYQRDTSDGRIVHSFLQSTLLYWFEALSLMGKMSDGVVAVTKLEALLKVSSDFEVIMYG
jgi:hypothetical protein